MYLAFYGLREAPFSPTPDPRFLFQSARHREALAQLVYGVRERKGFIVLTGEVGTGKTTLLRSLLERLDAATPVAYVHNPALGVDELLEYVLHDWGVKAVGDSRARRLIALNEFLIEEHRQGRAPVLVIDEAQNLPVEALEAIRMLSNFETADRKLIQILLVGQPELRQTLARPELRQLRQRIALRCHLGPLTPEETRLYIRHRLRVAGAADVGIFSDGAVQRIVDYTGGVPRLINIVCDHCLLAGYADSKRRVDARMVDEAIEYLEEGEAPKWRRLRAHRLAPRPALRRAARGGVAVLALTLLGMAVYAASVLGWLP